MAAANVSLMPEAALASGAATKGALWTGRILSGLVVVMLALDGVMKLVNPAPVVEATAKLGYLPGSMTGIGVLLLACTTLYTLPRTSVLGAVLLTGYLGGATATHVRVGDPLFSILFPSILGAILWGGLLLRDRRLRSILVLPR